MNEKVGDIYQSSYLGGKPDSPDMGCCKHVLGINVFRGPPCTTSRWTTLTILCWKEMAAIFQNGRHVKVILRNIQDIVRTEPHVLGIILKKIKCSTR